MTSQPADLGQSVCPVRSVGGPRCQLPQGHNSPHQHEGEHGKMTWEPSYVGDLRHELEDGPWRWRALLEDVLADLGDSLHSESIDDARRALRRRDDA